LALPPVALTAAASQVWAQAYPNKPVHVIISFSPGSSTDIVGRVVAQKLAEMWGQPVLAENRAGAGGSIGTAFVAKAAADGYTLLIDFQRAHGDAVDLREAAPTMWTRTSSISCRWRCSRMSLS